MADTLSMAAILFTIPKNTTFIGIGMTAFDRSGLEKYLPGYRTVRLTDIASGTFKTRNGEHLFLVAYKHSTTLETVAAKFGLTVLASPISVQQQFENKVRLRRLANQLPFAQFEIHDTAALNIALCKNLLKKFSSFIIQDEALSGGKGTYHVTDNNSFTKAITGLQAANSTQVVISRFIPGADVSLQGCITAHGIFIAGLQEPIIGAPELVNTQLPGTTQFCGGLWKSDGYPNTIQAEAYRIAQTIAQEMQQTGYRGIFGIDFRIDTAGKPYVIEVNARLTGFTPILTMLQEEAGLPPLLLLHVLELAHIPYTLSNTVRLQKEFRRFQPVSYALLYNRRLTAISLTQPLSAGVYGIQSDGSLTYNKPGKDLRDIPNTNQILVIDPPQPQQVIKPGRRIARFMSRKPLFANQQLTPQGKAIAAWLESRFAAV